MSKEVKTHNFRGKRYQIEKVAPSRLNPKGAKDKEKCLGICEPPTRKGKAIKIDKTLTDLEELDVYIHEALHSCYWDLDELAVERGATSIADFLWRLGYKRRDDD
jgi:hypothetical protein